MEYPLMEPPFVWVSFREMNKKQAEEYFQWYMTEIEKRICQLQEYINKETNQVILDKSPGSLINLWEWFEGKIEWEEKSEEEIQADLKRRPEWIHEYILQDTKKMTVLTMALTEDMAIYFSETMITNNPEVHWGYLTKPKKLDGVNQPILLGFQGDICVNPRRLVSVCISKSSEKKNRCKLYETYNRWLKNI